ncbi:MAG: FtsX-like permease family protein [Butyrivibrio sp.]|nr:FtsX-like permease family protein [Butyrivibrio sp.]
MDTILEYLESAMKNIVSNKMRTGLTMLGIIIGIASVIAVITLGNGMATYVTSEVNALGGNVGAIYLDTSVTDDWFTFEDERVLKETFPNLLGSSFTVSNMGVASGNRGAYDAAIYGAESDYQYTAGTKVKEGHYFTKDQVDSGAKVCVLMENDAKHLFGTTQAIGRTVEVSLDGYSVELEVIGIKENWSDMIMQMMELEGYFAYIEMPITTFGNTFGYNISEFSDMELYWPQDQPESIVSDVVRFFENRKGLRGQNAIYQMSMSDVSSEVNSIMGAVTTFISFVAAISLLVGGIGVMNIMLVSVTERTREIGIRKSIGARTKSIMVQFLAESSIISLMGGIIGVILGILIAEIGCRFLEFSVTIDPVTVLGAALFSMAIGLFFGIYPARKAAKLKPIDALSRR